jgi:hypothetical protein
MARAADGNQAAWAERSKLNVKVLLFHLCKSAGAADLVVPHRPVSQLALLLLGRQIDVYVAVDVPTESRGVFQHLMRHRLATLDGARY